MVPVPVAVLRRLVRLVEMTEGEYWRETRSQRDAADHRTADDRRVIDRARALLARIANEGDGE